MSTLESIISFLCSTILSTLPVRYRLKWLHPEHASSLGAPALVSGLAESLLGLGLFLARFFAIVPLSGIPPLSIALGRAGGFLTTINAVFEPLNMIFLFMFFEGAFRAIAGLVGESPPTLPLQLVAWLHDVRDRRSAERAMGPPVADEVETTASDPGILRIRSCRPKPHWHPYVSIRYRGAFWTVAAQVRIDGPRQFVYDLRKRRDEEAVVVVYAYDPDESRDPAPVPVRWTPADTE